MLPLLKKIAGFCTIGAAMTLLSMLLIAITNEVFCWHPQISYAFAYVVTLLLSYALNAKYVFHSAFSFQRLFFYCTAYIMGMFLGMLLLKLEMLLLPQFNKTILSYAVIPVTLIWNFFFINKILTTKMKQNERKFLQASEQHCR